MITRRNAGEKAVFMAKYSARQISNISTEVLRNDEKRAGSGHGEVKLVNKMKAARGRTRPSLFWERY